MAQSHIEVRVDLQDANGLPYPGFKAYFYNAGTTTPRTVYTDEALTIPHAVPVVADSAGLLPRIFVPVGTYKAKYTTSGDVDIRTDDNIDPGLSTSAGALAVANGGTGATTAASARSNLSVPSQAVFDALDTRVTDVETTLANPLIAPNDVTTYAAAINPNFTAKQVQTITLTGNLTLGATVTGTAGQEFTVILIQDATGNRVITLGAGFHVATGVQPVFSTTANSVDVITGIMRTSSIAEVTSIKVQDNVLKYAVVTIRNPYAVSTSPSVAHGIVNPISAIPYLECITANQGYAVGDKLIFGTLTDGAANTTKPTAFWNATNVGASCPNTLPVVMNFSTQVQGAITAANWKIMALVQGE
jgi:hypothetical protein